MPSKGEWQSRGSGADGGGLAKITTLKAVMVVTAKGLVRGTVEIMTKLWVMVTKVMVLVVTGGRAGGNDGVGGEDGGDSGY